MIVTTPKPWLRTTRRRPCPICRGSGCLISAAVAPEAAVCLRVESAKPIGVIGWLHLLNDRGPTWCAWRRSLTRLARME